MEENTLLNTRWKKPNSLAKPFEEAQHIFAHMSEQQKKIIALNARVQPIFHTHASMEVSVAHFENGHLTIAADSIIAVNHLNYLHSLFIEKLQGLAELANMTKLSFVYIEPLKPRLTNSQQHKTKKISEESRQLLQKTASIIRDNPELSQALRHLSDNA